MNVLVGVQFWGGGLLSWSLSPAAVDVLCWCQIAAVSRSLGVGLFAGWTEAGLSRDLWGPCSGGGQLRKPRKQGPRSSKELLHSEPKLY